MVTHLRVCAIDPIQPMHCHTLLCHGHGPLHYTMATHLPVCAINPTQNTHRRALMHCGRSLSRHAPTHRRALMHRGRGLSHNTRYLDKEKEDTTEF